MNDQSDFPSLDLTALNGSTTNDQPTNTTKDQLIPLSRMYTRQDSLESGNDSRKFEPADLDFPAKQKFKVVEHNDADQRAEDALRIIENALQKDKIPDDDLYVIENHLESNHAVLTTTGPALEGEIKSYAPAQAQYERVLHKMVTNTLAHYDIGAIYSPDKIINIFKDNDLLQYADIATEQGNVQNLNSIMDFGAKPLS